MIFIFINKRTTWELIISAELVECLGDVSDPLHDSRQLHFINFRSLFLLEFVRVPPPDLLSDLSLHHDRLLD